jgi:hypothetical protein
MLLYPPCITLPLAQPAKWLWRHINISITQIIQIRACIQYRQRLSQTVYQKKTLAITVEPYKTWAHVVKSHPVDILQMLVLWEIRLDHVLKSETVQ